jgi:hypothetical protein
MSTGELTVIPEVIYLTKEKLKRRLKRSPTDQELAAELKISPSALSKLKHVKVKYSETTLTPSLAATRGVVAYRHAKPWSKKHRGNPFATGSQYDSDGGGKRKTRRSRRTQNRNRNKTKRSNQH